MSPKEKSDTGLLQLFGLLLAALAAIAAYIVVLVGLSRVSEPMAVIAAVPAVLIIANSVLRLVNPDV